MLMEFGALKGHSSHISGWGPNVRFWPVSDLRRWSSVPTPSGPSPNVKMAGLLRPNRGRHEHLLNR